MLLQCKQLRGLAAERIGHQRRSKLGKAPERVSTHGRRIKTKKIQEEGRRDLLKCLKKIQDENRTVFRPALSHGFRLGLRTLIAERQKAMSYQYLIYTHIKLKCQYSAFMNQESK